MGVSVVIGCGFWLLRNCRTQHKKLLEQKISPTPFVQVHFSSVHRQQIFFIKMWLVLGCRNRVVWMNTELPIKLCWSLQRYIKMCRAVFMLGVGEWSHFQTLCRKWSSHCFWVMLKHEQVNDDKYGLYIHTRIEVINVDCATCRPLLHASAESTSRRLPSSFLPPLFFLFLEKFFNVYSGGALGSVPHHVARGWACQKILARLFETRGSLVPPPLAFLFFSCFQPRP